MVCAYNLPRLLTGTVQFDSLEVHYASQRYLSDELHAGRMPFWTPYVFSGFPFLADIQVGAWYPLHWPFYAVGIQPWSINAELLVHDLVAAGGTFALGLRWIGRAAPAASAALFYALSGWFAAHSQHVGMYAAAAWLPWLVLCLSSLGNVVSLPRLVSVSLLGALTMLLGHFQVALYALTFVGLWAALEAAARRSATHARSYSIGIAALLVGGGLLSAVMILPGLELVQNSVRTELNARNVDIGYFRPADLLTLVNPDAYGLLSGHYTGPGDTTQHYFYAGILLAPLALLGLGNRPIARSAAFLGIPFVWYAAGPVGGLFRLVARIPGFSSVELPMHGWFLPALGLALLGGAGMAQIEQRLGRRWIAALLVVVLLDVLTCNQLLNPLAYARSGFDQLYGGPLTALQAQLAVASPRVDRLYGAPLAAVAYRNHALQSRVETTYGYNPLELIGYADYAAAAEDNPRLIGGFSATHRLTDDLRIAAEPNMLPLAYFAQSIRLVPDAASARAALAELDPARETLVVGLAPRVQPEASARVSVVVRGVDALTAHYVSGSTQLLRLAIPAYPGWHASLDSGTDLPLLTVDHAFIGVLVPPGDGDLNVWYAPRLFALGAAISLATLATLLLVLLGYLRTRRAIARPSP